MTQNTHLLEIFLPKEQNTISLGQDLAAAITALHPESCILLLQGELGAGKTTLIRGLIQGLPGGENAQVSSPSFNLVNDYPTSPRTLHLDLYRLSGMEAAEIFWENLSQEQEPGIMVVEWSEHLPPEELPRQYLLFSLYRQNHSRLLQITPFGLSLQPVVRNLAQKYNAE